MLLVSLFLAGFTLGVFFALKVFAPEKQEDLWDPQFFSQKISSASKNTFIKKETEDSSVLGPSVVISKKQLISANKI